MILYFSATGNSLSVAKEIAAATGDKLFDMGAAFRDGRFEVVIEQGADLGIVFPTYRWSTPNLVDKFVRKMKLVTPDGQPATPGYCYLVETFGNLPGNETRFLTKQLVKHQGINVSSCYAVRSVGNCLYLFKIPPDDVVKSTLDQAASQTQSAIERITKRTEGNRVKAHPFGALMSLLMGTENKPRPVKQFNVMADQCIGCGTCAKVCPTNTISMVDGKPAWSGTECAECLACIHHCPQDASQYGTATVGRKRYLNPILK